MATRTFARGLSFIGESPLGHFSFWGFSPNAAKSSSPERGHNHPGTDGNTYKSHQDTGGVSLECSFSRRWAKNPFLEEKMRRGRGLAGWGLGAGSARRWEIRF